MTSSNSDRNDKNKVTMASSWDAMVSPIPSESAPAMGVAAPMRQSSYCSMNNSVRSQVVSAGTAPPSLFNYAHHAQQVAPQFQWAALQQMVGHPSPSSSSSLFNPMIGSGQPQQQAPLDPHVLAIMQNPMLAYKYLSTFINQQVQQQQSMYAMQPPPAVHLFSATPNDAFIRFQQQQQQQQQLHHHQQELTKTLKSLSLDDSPASNSNDSTRGGTVGGRSCAEGTIHRSQNSTTSQDDVDCSTRSNSSNNNAPVVKRGAVGSSTLRRPPPPPPPTQQTALQQQKPAPHYRSSANSNETTWYGSGAAFSSSSSLRRCDQTRKQNRSPYLGRQSSSRWEAIRELAYNYRKERGGVAGSPQHPHHHHRYNTQSNRMTTGADSDAGLLPRNTHLEANLFGNPSAGINFDQYEKIPVDVNGFDGLQPIKSFCCEGGEEEESIHFHPILTNNVQLACYDKPTPVQKYTIPAIMARRDIMACAQTGSGKTAAFLLPIINQMLEASMLCRTGCDRGNNGRFAMQSPRCLILAPTRELCLQIFNEARKFSYRSLMRIVVVYGGANLRQQMKEIYRGVDLVVATPGRLIDVVERNCLQLHEIRFLVLDEADRMLDMGFEPQIRKIVEQLNMPSKHERQTSMFSATFPKPIRELARQFLNDYIFLCVGRIGSTSENIEQRIIYADESNKIDALLRILAEQEGDPCLTLIFVETKRSADELEQFLRKRGYNVGCIHGDRNQSDREYALGQFRNGQISILVATAVAARGLDVPNVFHVINYDLPTDIDDYVHRIGRTGRGGNEGLASSFFNERNSNIASDLVAILTESKQEIPEFLRHMQDAQRYRKYDNRKRQYYRGARSATFGRQFSRGSARPSILSGRRFSAATNNTSDRSSLR